jgi:hypothetical protein
MSEHDQIPWEYRFGGLYSDNKLITQIDEDNGRFVCQAVNSYDELCQLLVVMLLWDNYAPPFKLKIREQVKALLNLE